MLNKQKNHTYIIQINLLILDQSNQLVEKQHIYTSNHAYKSKKFQSFLTEKMEQVEGFVSFADDAFKQYAVSINNFCE